MLLSPMRRRLVAAALWVYPRRWRERYGEEVLDLVEANGITRRDVVVLCVSALEERLRTDPRLDASVAGRVRRFIVAVVLAYIAAVSVFLVVSIVWQAASTVAYMYRWAVFGSFEPTLGLYLAQRWEFGWRMAVVAVPVYLGYCVTLAVPVVALLALTRCGSSWPGPARVPVVVAFLAFPLWALGPVVATILIPAAWCFASVLFPSHPPNLPLAPEHIGRPS